MYIAKNGSDLLALHMENYDLHADFIQLKKIDPVDIQSLTMPSKPKPLEVEPRIPLRSVRAKDYRADEPFDLIFLARSPSFTPDSSDKLYDAIQERYIEGP